MERLYTIRYDASLGGGEKLASTKVSFYYCHDVEDHSSSWLLELVGGIESIERRACLDA